MHAGFDDQAVAQPTKLGISELFEEAEQIPIYWLPPKFFARSEIAGDNDRSGFHAVCEQGDSATFAIPNQIRAEFSKILAGAGAHPSLGGKNALDLEPGQGVTEFECSSL